MKRSTIPILVALLAAFSTRADTALSLAPYYGCVTDLGPNPIASPPTVNGSFNVPGVSGSGTLQSQVPSYYYANFQDPNVKDFVYNYTIDLSGMSPSANHCVRLVIHFGEPVGCLGSGVSCNPSQVQSATLAPFGDIMFVFAGGCLNPGQPSVFLGMLSAPGSFKTNVVTVIDDYVDPSSGLTNEVKINVPAIVPDIPPDPPPWEIASYYSRLIPTIQYQGGIGSLVTNGLPPPPPINGLYDFSMQLVDAPSNGLAISQLATQTVQVVNGLFNLPLPFDPASYGAGTPGWWNIGIRPSGLAGVPFTTLKPPNPNHPPNPNNPTPQALFAYSAGVVSDLMPGQALTSLNGLADGVTLQAGSGIMLSSSGNTITFSATGTGLSDRNLKTDLVPVNPETVLARLTAMPIESWRFTNEVAGIRHVGPLAQDFKAAFGLGNSDKTIGYLDASGVALAAVRGLNQKLVQGFQRQDAQDADLEQQIEATKQLLNQINQKLNGGEK